MIPCLLSLLIGASVAEYPLSERAPLGLVVTASGLELSTRKALVENLVAEIEANSLLRVDDVTDLSAAADNPTLALLEALARRNLGQGEQELPPIVLVLSFLPSTTPGRVLLARQVIFARDALRALALRAESRSPDGIVEQYSRLSNLEELPTAEVASRLPARLRAALRPELERRGLWRPQGSVLIEVEGSGLLIRLDGRVVGEALTGPVLLERVAQGSRKVTIEQAGYARAEGAVEVQASEVARFAPVLLDLRVEAARAPRAAVAVTGTALMASGAVLLGIALVEALSSAPPCVALRERGDCPGAEVTFARVGGVPVAPIGYSLLGAGALMGGGVWATSDATQPWWFLVAGVGLGAAALGVSLWAE